MKSKLLALSAISAAFSAIALTIGIYFSTLDLFCLVVASVFCMLPLYYSSYKAGFLAFLVGGVIAFIFSGFNLLIAVVPAYFVFFGSFPLFNVFMRQKKINRFLLYIIGLIWCVLAVFGIYFYYVNIIGIVFNDFPKIIAENIYIFLLLAGIIFYVVYERYIVAMKRIMDYYLKKHIG